MVFFNLRKNSLKRFFCLFNYSLLNYEMDAKSANLISIFFLRKQFEFSIFHKAPAIYGSENFINVLFYRYKRCKKIVIVKL